jgi:hypothetical protein
MRIGEINLQPLSDGTFIARPRYFGDHVPPGSHPELFDRHQAASAWPPPTDWHHFVTGTGELVPHIRAGRRWYT